MIKTQQIIKKLYNTNNLSSNKLCYLINNATPKDIHMLSYLACKVRNKVYGNKVFLRGIIEFSNYCKNSCRYCGLRKDNKSIRRVRMELSEIIECCKKGYDLGIRTFVLQSGEDYNNSDIKISNIIKQIKDTFPDVAITLSIGEKDDLSYLKYLNQGANRYLLRHETANRNLYDIHHPNMSFENRINCLYSLKEMGYQTGAGFIVDLPGQTTQILSKDLCFIKSLDPHMVGIGPFIPQKNTPLSNKAPGSVKKTLLLLSIIRLLLPKVLLPTTTALATLDHNGFAKGLNAGANVIMPNLTSKKYRDAYKIYDGKENTKDILENEIESIKDIILSQNCKLSISRGDHKDYIREERK